MAITDEKLDRVSVVGGGSVYTAVQNLMLACRAEGLGCVLTTLLCEHEEKVREILDDSAAVGHGCRDPDGLSDREGSRPDPAPKSREARVREPVGNVARMSALIDAAQRLAPSVAARAAEIEHARRVPADLSKQMAAAGFYRMFVPRPTAVSKSRRPKHRACSKRSRAPTRRAVGSRSSVLPAVLCWRVFRPMPLARYSATRKRCCAAYSRRQATP